jgi:uncharacterized protein (DUF4415 family)
MKQRKRVTRRQKVRRIEAAADEWKRPWEQERGRCYGPGFLRTKKKRVTLSLDADVLAWFQKQGRGYQTRINQALREAMVEERKKTRE